MAVIVIILFTIGLWEVVGSGLVFHNTFPSVIFMYKILQKLERKIEHKKSLNIQVFNFPFKKGFSLNHLSCFSFGKICLSLIVFTIAAKAFFKCAHKNLFSCKVLTVQKYLKFCAVITSFYW